MVSPEFSHSPAQLKKLCSQVLWLENARVVMLGDPDKVLGAYQEFCKNPDQWMQKHPDLFYNVDVDTLKRSGYFRYHLPRYEVLLKKTEKYQPAGDAKILEIGPSRLSQLPF